MDEKKLKTVIGLVYIALSVVVVVLLIDLQIKNAILKQADQTRKELDKFQHELGVQNGIILEATASGRVDYFPSDLRGNVRGDDPGMAVADMAGTPTEESGAISGLSYNETVSYSGDGSTEVPSDN